MNKRTRLLLSVPIVVLASGPAAAASEDVSVADVEQARRCALASREAARAFGDVRDALKAGSSRVQNVIDRADAALASARSACGGNADVAADLDGLVGEIAEVRRAVRAGN